MRQQVVVEGVGGAAAGVHPTCVRRFQEVPAGGDLQLDAGTVTGEAVVVGGPEEEQALTGTHGAAEGHRGTPGLQGEHRQPSLGPPPPARLPERSGAVRCVGEGRAGPALPARALEPEVLVDGGGVVGPVGALDRAPGRLGQPARPPAGLGQAACPETPGPSPDVGRPVPGEERALPAVRGRAAQRQRPAGGAEALRHRAAVVPAVEQQERGSAPPRPGQATRGQGAQQCARRLVRPVGIEERGAEHGQHRDRCGIQPGGEGAHRQVAAALERSHHHAGAEPVAVLHHEQAQPGPLRQVGRRAQDRLGLERHVGLHGDGGQAPPPLLLRGRDLAHREQSGIHQGRRTGRRGVPATGGLRSHEDDQEKDQDEEGRG